MIFFQLDISAQTRIAEELDSIILFISEFFHGVAGRNFTFFKKALPGIFIEQMSLQIRTSEMTKGWKRRGIFRTTSKHIVVD
jgi:hypothetical protein